MKTNAWLVIDGWGKVRATKRVPTLQHGEIAAKLRLEVPDEYFVRPRLEIHAIVEMPTKESPQIDIEITENALREATGANLRLTVIEEEEDDLPSHRPQRGNGKA